MPRRRRAMPCTLALLLVAVSLAAQAPASQSRWVHPSPSASPGRKLMYAQTPRGDRIVDFSYAGYRGGGVALPTVPTRITLQPSGSDDTAAIQAALDKISVLALSNGSRGAVELAPGTFHATAELTLRASGIVLRGAGPTAATGTTLELTGKPHLGLRIAGNFQQKSLGNPITLAPDYVPSGTRVLKLKDASSLHPGDTILLTKPAAPAWVHFMGMDNLERPGRDEHWIGGALTTLRRIVAVEGNMIALDVPLTDNIDPAFFQAAPPTVTRVEVSGQLAETGVEALRITAPARSIAYQEDAEFDGVSLSAVVDSWLRDLAFEDTTNSVRIELNSARITVSRVDVLQRKSVTSAAKNFMFSCNGTQVLFDRCSGRGDTLIYLATQARVQGPVVALRCHFEGDGRIQPHQRWSTGLLVDECSVPGGGIDLKNRGIQGSGHGWTTGWSVVWNSSAAGFLVQMPPGVANWLIGSRGELQTSPMPDGKGRKGPDLPMGVIDSPGKPVAPASLYLAQLRDRLGPAALTALGYTPADIDKLP